MMKSMISILLALLSFVCFAEPPNKAGEELDIREAAFRYQFDKNASSQQQSARYFYLAITDGDKKSAPDDAFVRRFAERKPPVKKISECVASAEKGVADKKTGERGLIFTTGAIKWVSDAEAEISGGYYEAGLSASGNTYYVKKVNGKWKVIKDVMHWIS